MQSINEEITADADVLSGTPVFRGTRVSIKTLFDYLEASSLDEFLLGFPTVSREQAETVIEFAAALLHNITTRHEGTTR